MENNNYISNKFPNQVHNNQSQPPAVTNPARPKKRIFQRIVFYFMALLMVATTGLSGYIAYNIYKQTHSENDTETNDSTSDDSVAAGTTTNNNFTPMSAKMLNELREESYLLGQEDILSSVRTMMENGNSTLQMLRSLYPEHLIYSDTGGFVFHEINSDLAMHNYSEEGFKIVKNNSSVPTSVEYYENDKLASYKGIDVSKHNGTIDWTKVKADGVDFAILRAAVRGYGGEGKLLIDESFEENAKAAIENDIAIGAYVFSEAITVEEAIEEAELVLSMIEPYEIQYPVIIDIEDIYNDAGRNESLTPAKLTDIVLAFCDTIKDAGYTPMLYCNLKGFLGMLEFERLEGIEKWYAYYGDDLYFPYDVSMWQYTSSGTVNGITGNVDINISFKNYE